MLSLFLLSCAFRIKILPAPTVLDQALRWALATFIVCSTALEQENGCLALSTYPSLFKQCRMLSHIIYITTLWGRFYDCHLYFADEETEAWINHRDVGYTVVNGRTGIMNPGSQFQRLSSWLFHRAASGTTIIKQVSGVFLHLPNECCCVPAHPLPFAK